MKDLRTEVLASPEPAHVLGLVYSEAALITSFGAPEPGPSALASTTTRRALPKGLSGHMALGMARGTSQDPGPLTGLTPLTCSGNQEIPGRPLVLQDSEPNPCLSVPPQTGSEHPAWPVMGAH